jgi:hypothetical protein
VREGLKVQYKLYTCKLHLRRFRDFLPAVLYCRANKHTPPRSRAASLQLQLHDHCDAPLLGSSLVSSHHCYQHSLAHPATAGTFA